MRSAAVGKPLTLPLCIWSAWKFHGISQERHQPTPKKAPAVPTVYYGEGKIVPKYHAVKLCRDTKVNLYLYRAVEANRIARRQRSHIL